jgi:hypothetical protein
VVRTVKYNLARFKVLVKRKSRSSLSIPLTSFLVFSIFHSFEKSFFSGGIYAKAKLCFKKTKPPKLCGDFLLLELQAYGGMNL